MAQKEVRISDKAIEEVAHVAYFIEGKGLPETAKRFVDVAFSFFQKLGDSRLLYKPCSHPLWKESGYRCAIFKRKFVVAYLDLGSEILICDFAPQKLLQQS